MTFILILLCFIEIFGSTIILHHFINHSLLKNVTKVETKIIVYKLTFTYNKLNILLAQIENFWIVRREYSDVFIRGCVRTRTPSLPVETDYLVRSYKRMPSSYNPYLNLFSHGRKSTVSSWKTEMGLISLYELLSTTSV